MRGLELARRFYFDGVRPVLDDRFPRLPHAAALIGPGSEVLGFDDEMSQDHHWGPRLQLFVSKDAPVDEIDATLRDRLPTDVAGFPTHFGDPDDIGVRLLTPLDGGPVSHLVEIVSLGAFLEERIGVDPRTGFAVADWLATPAQRLAELTGGAVFNDDEGELTRVREALSFYPHDVWLLVMAGLWRRVAQLEHFLGRTGSVGDDVGSRIVAASLVRDLMRVALIQERRYPPYWKWLGTAYANVGRPEAAALEAALSASTWQEREDAVVAAYEAVAERHNELGVTRHVEPSVRQFWGRPFRVLFADRFVDALRAAIDDPDVQAIEHDAGSIDSVSDNTDVLTRPFLWRAFADLYDRP